MPVYVLENEMPYDEFLKWTEYFKIRPIGWRDDDRTYKLLQVQGVKAKGESIFESLYQMKINTPKAQLDDNMIDMNNLKRSYLFSKMLSAKGGDKIDYN